MNSSSQMAGRSGRPTLSPRGSRRPKETSWRSEVKTHRARETHLNVHTSIARPDNLPSVRFPERRSARAFDEAGGAHAAADAHRDDGVAALAAFELVQRGRNLPRAGRTERVAEGDRAAVDVHTLRRQAELALAVERLRGE